jgi:putative DNA-invertase from lambdoid prophage Rac
LTRAAIYNRVSTTSQGDPAKAMAELRAAAAQRGYAVSLEVAETGSGAKNNRPGLARVLEAARRGKVDALLVTRLDRFGRSSLDLLANIRALTDAGVRFVCTEQAIDIKPGGDPMANLILTVLAGVAEFERAIIRDRVLEGQRRAKRKGIHLGRPVTAQPDPASVARLRQDGRSWAGVSTELGATIGACRRALAR